MEEKEGREVEVHSMLQQKFCYKTLVVAGAGNRELKTVASSKVPSDVKQRHRTQEVRTVHITNSTYCYQD